MPHDLAFKRRTDGTIQFVYHPNDKATRNAIALLGIILGDKRAGFVWPRSLLYRVVFRLLRKAFGSNGRIAAWTRTWRCQWIVIDSNTMEVLPGIHDSHDKAVEAEIQWSLEHGFPQDAVR